LMISEEVASTGSKGEILGKIRGRSARVAVFGLGQIGLPIATVISERGFHVSGVDTNPAVVEAVSSRSTRAFEEQLNERVGRAVEGGFLEATQDGANAVQQADIILVCVPTPIRDNNRPDMGHIFDACSTIADNINPGALVIVESSLPPGYTASTIVPLIEERSGLRCGSDFWLAYCPERLTPGNSLNEFNGNAKVVGGFDGGSTKIASEFFRATIEGPIMETDAATAEVSKVAENSFRDVNIAYANELALICEEVGVDVQEVIRMANTHPRVLIHKPGLGVGGPCLPKDPYLLLHPVSSKGFRSEIIKASRSVNDSMPLHVARLVLKALQGNGKGVEGARIAVLGAAYKPDVGLTESSPSKTLISWLREMGANVKVFDPHCKEGLGAEPTDSLESAVENADCLVVAVAHREFRDLDLVRMKEMMGDRPIIVDAPRIIDRNNAERHGFSYYGVGVGSHDDGTEN